MALLESIDPSAEALTPVVARRYVHFVGEHAEHVDADVIGEIRFTLFVEDRELVTLMCSAWQLKPLVVGFLYLEGLIDTIDDIEMLRVCLATYEAACYERVHQQMRAEGLLAALPTRPLPPEVEDFAPEEIPGPPLSETILEERR